MSDSDLVAALYDAAVDPDQWNAALRAVCQRFDAGTGLLMIDAPLQPGPHLIAAVNWSEAALGLYGEHYSALDPYQAALRRKPAGTEVILGQDVIDAGHFEDSPIWVDYSKKHVGAFHFLGASLDVALNSPAGIGLHRPRDGVPFDDSDRLRLAELTRHLEFALRLSKKLDHGRALLQTATLESLSHGLAVVSIEGRVLYANRAADELGRDGRVNLGTQRSHIQAGCHVQTMRLLAFVHSAAAGGLGGDMRVETTADRPPLALSVTPLPMSMRGLGSISLGSPRGMALITVREISPAVTPPTGRLMSLFGLTHAEAAIVPYLLRGETANAIANRRSTSPLTVQSQIRQVLAKTGAPNLRALAALLLPLGG